MDSNLTFALTRLVELLCLLVIVKLVDIGASVFLSIYGYFASRSALSRITELLGKKDESKNP